MIENKVTHRATYPCGTIVEWGERFRRDIYPDGSTEVREVPRSRNMGSFIVVVPGLKPDDPRWYAVNYSFSEEAAHLSGKANAETFKTEYKVVLIEEVSE